MEVQLKAAGREPGRTAGASVFGQSCATATSLLTAFYIPVSGLPVSAELTSCSIPAALPVVQDFSRLPGSGLPVPRQRLPGTAWLRLQPDDAHTASTHAALPATHANHSPVVAPSSAIPGTTPSCGSRHSQGCDDAASATLLAGDASAGLPIFPVIPIIPIFAYVGTQRSSAAVHPTTLKCGSRPREKRYAAAPAA